MSGRADLWKRALSLLGMLTMFSSLVTVHARDLYWPVDCEPGSRQCLSNVFYPDTDGDGLAANCESPGYTNHRGTDVNAVQNAVSGGIDVNAAADGIVKWVFDGKNDQCPSSHPDCQAPPSGWAEPEQTNGYRVCSDNNNQCPNGEMGCFYCFDGGNVVVMEHPDSEDVFATRYYHLKRNSITVSPGQNVTAGQKIGEVGSSGDSRWPHLHFEVSVDTHRNVIDPWAGTCARNDTAYMWKYDPPWIAPPRALPGNHWRQISLPAVAPNGQNSVNGLFSDDISGSYGTAWNLYRYDSAINRYEELAPNDVLSVGSGYWMRHNNSATRELDLPAASLASATVSDARCATGSNQCVSVELIATQPRVQWHMVGNPFSHSLSLANLRVVTNAGTCTNGCTLDQASSENLVHSQLFAFADGPNYDVLQGVDQLPAWQGAWMATLSGASALSINLLWAKD
ncbi:MAG: M23 family metallopeptidase [Granulosicoccus sp.]|nr:M23 family metallopeptidase [Granulosicoccus sp.]